MHLVKLFHFSIFGIDFYCKNKLEQKLKVKKFYFSIFRIEMRNKNSSRHLFSLLASRCRSSAATSSSIVGRRLPPTPTPQLLSINRCSPPRSHQLPAASVCLSSSTDHRPSATTAPTIPHHSCLLRNSYKNKNRKIYFSSRNQFLIRIMIIRVRSGHLNIRFTNQIGQAKLE